MSDTENPTVEDVIISSFKTLEALPTVDEVRRSLRSTNNTIENLDGKTLRSFYEQSWHLGAEEKSQQIFGKQPQDLHTSEERSANDYEGTTGQRKTSLGMFQELPAGVEKQKDNPSSSKVLGTDPDSNLPLPAERARSKTTVQEKPTPAPRQIPTTQRKPYSLSNVQNQATNLMQWFTNFLPREYRGEMWIYAAGYVFLYSILMLFTTSTFGFICMMIYVALVTLLVMRFFDIGPLVRRTQR